MRTKTSLTILLFSILLLSCAPRPPSWPPLADGLGETSTWYVNAERRKRSAHGNLACADCHVDLTPGDPNEPHPDPARLLLSATNLYDYQTCATCHPQEVTAYGQGAHAEALAHPENIKLDAAAPTCGDCHNAHYATAETRTELLDSNRETCGLACHATALETYERNYHGQAALLGYGKTATCADCHGAHNVLALSQADEALPVCRRCHPKAKTRLVSYRIHAHETLDVDPEDPRAGDFRLFFWVKLFFTVLVVGTLGFFYTHTGLWFLRSLHERLGKNRHE